MTILRYALLLSAGMFFSIQVLAGDAEYQSHEKPMPDTVLDEQGSMGEALGTEEPIEKKPERAWRPGDLLWNKASVTFKPRSYYLNKLRTNDTDKLAWALGGALEYRSGSYKDRFSLGTTLYTSQKLHGPRDKDGTRLLRPHQKEFTVLGEAYLDIKLPYQMDMRLFRQTLNLPYLNKNDTRMAPNTFEAYALSRSEPELRLNYGIGYVTRMKLRNKSSFKYMSEIAGAEGSNNGLGFAAARYNFSKLINIGFAGYHTSDVINTFYTEANSAWDLGDDLAIRISGQYTKQKSTGDELIGDFDTHVVGAKLGLSYKNAILNLAYTSTDENNGIQNPYGGYPGYTSIMVKDFNRAGEDAWLIGFSFNAARFGLGGLTVFANYVDGNTPDSGSAASPDQQEFDITADYIFSKDFADGFWVRTRAAVVNQDGPDDVDQNDYRIILNYSIPLH
jgi:hypothetical protein